MNKETHILPLSESMELTMDKANLSVIAGLGEVAIDAIIEDGVLRDIPIIGSIVGTGKCIKNVSDVLFTKKLIAFLFELRDTDAHEREEAIERWENDARYRVRVGETLLNMINRCDDTQKAKWLSKLFYHLVLKKGYSDVFMRSEKTLSSLSVMDVYSFLALPKDKYMTLTIEETEWYSNSGLYMMEDHGEINGIEFIQIPQTKMCVTEVGMYIYNILNETDFLILLCVI